jgi:hypothetical protein
MSAAGAPPGPDAAWVVLETSVGAAELAAFCRDLERLYRINPFLEFKSWRQSAADRFTAQFVNHSNRQEVLLEGTVARASDLEFRIDFTSGLKRRTRFEIRPRPHGASLTITDEYGPAGGSAPPEAEIDRSLHAWGVALRVFLERDRRWGWVPLYRPCMRRLWLPMSPSARRIAYLVLAIGLADALLIALGFAIYWLEAGH